MKKFTKNLMQNSAKVFVLFLIVSILVPAPMFATVYTVHAEESAPVAEIAPSVDATAIVSIATADVVTNSNSSDPSTTEGTVVPATEKAHSEPTPASEPESSGNGSSTLNCVLLDMNNDGTVDRTDFDAFELAFNNGDIRADFDGSGFLTANDFQSYMDAYTRCSSGNTLTCPRLDMNNDGIVNSADFVAFETAFNNGEMRTDFDNNGILNANDFQVFIDAYSNCVHGSGPAPTCPLVDINHDGKVDRADFTAFEVAFNNGEMRTDFDHNGLLNANDFQAYINAYANCISGGGTNPSAGSISLTPSSGSTTEAGGEFQFTVTLNTVPTAPVKIDLLSDNTAEGTLSVSSIELSGSHMSEVVTVTGVDDSTDDGDVVYSIVSSPAVSADPNYNNINIPDISLVNIDDESSTTGGGNGGGSTGGGGGGSGFSSVSSGSGFGVGGLGEVLGASTVNPNLCNYLGAYLKKGDKNNTIEVMKLQAFLKTLEGSSDVQVNGIFDDATFNAVSNFQKKYGTDILEPWGYDSNSATGYVYILTKKKVNEIVCKSPVALTSAQQSEIDAFKASMKSLALGEVVKKKSVTVGL